MCRLVHFKTILDFFLCNKREGSKTLYSWQKSHFLKFDKAVNKVKWPTMAEFVGELQTNTVSLLEVIQESPCKVSSFVIFACFTFNFSFLTSFDILLRASSRLCIAYVHSQYYCFQASVKSKLGLFPLSISFNQQSLRNRKSHIRYLMVLHINICFTQLVRRRVNSVSVVSTESQNTSLR